MSPLLSGLAWLAPVLAASGEGLHVPDVVLTDQHGKAHHVYADLVQGRVVAFNFIFTSCPTVCRPMSATFARAQSLLAGRPVRLISVSIDPRTDTPERLALWAARFDAGPSWTLLTGEPRQVDELRKALGVYTPDRFAHSPTVVILDAAGRATRVDGLGSARALADAIEARLGAK